VAAAYTANPELIIASLIREGRDTPDPMGYLRGIQRTALAASIKGDEYATSLNTEGGGSTWMREIPANILAQFCESAMQRLEATSSGGPAGGLRGGDFSSYPSTLG
jgi:hypothetical protein